MGFINPLLGEGLTLWEHDLQVMDVPCLCLLVDWPKKSRDWGRLERPKCMELPLENIYESQGHTSCIPPPRIGRIAYDSDPHPNQAFWNRQAPVIRAEILNVYSEIHIFLDDQLVSIFLLHCFTQKNPRKNHWKTITLLRVIPTMTFETMTWWGSTACWRRFCLKLLSRTLPN